MVVMRDERVVILCGGKGTRIRDVSEELPKPLIPVGGKPILWHIMKGYHSQGYNKFVLCLGYKGNKIKDFFLNYKNANSNLKIESLRNDSFRYINSSEEIEDFDISLIDTGEESLTGKRLYLVKDFLKHQENFMLTYGDGVSDVNLEELYKFHKNSDKLVTLTAVNPRSKYGLVEADANGIVTSFEEKPVLKSQYINCGFMVFKKEFLDHPSFNGDNLMLEDLIKGLIPSRQLARYSHGGFFHSMDSMSDYASLNKIWESGNIPWKNW